MQLSGVPGMAMAIVEHGQVTLARGYGVRRLGSADSVDADTIFEIGSVSKAFTAAALAVLVDRGKIRWDDPVINHITGFQMYDPWVTREITVLDLLVPGGEVQRISMRAVSPRADFSWDYPDLDFRPARK